MLIFRKSILALTGLFICFFLIAHLSANFLLLLPEEQARTLYNTYSETLRSNPLITIVAYINYACIIFHVIYALLITLKNRQARHIGYGKVHADENSTWTSRNMLFLGFLILAFIIIHMANFWFKVKIQGQDDDLYQMVVDLFREPLYLVIYVGSMLPLGLHLTHAVHSAFRTLGLYHKRYLALISKISLIYAIIISVGFAIIPLILFFR
jgi:succinate dehydrogenase / fumarate reductase cytochrome b subunit